MGNKDKDKQGTNKETKPGYRIWVTGQYYAVTDSGNKSLKFYKPVSFDFPQVVSYVQGNKYQTKMVMDAEKGLIEAPDTSKPAVPNVLKANANNVALHLIRRFYLEDYLKDTHEGFVKIRTCEIFKREHIKIDPKEVADVSTQSIQDMKRSELAQYILINDIGVTLDMYGDLADAKNAVENAMAKVQVEEVQPVPAGQVDPMAEPDSGLFS